MVVLLQVLDKHRAHILLTVEIGSDKRLDASQKSAVLYEASRIAILIKILGRAK